MTKFLQNLAKMFEGNYSHRSEALQVIKDEVFDISCTPAPKQDSTNLNADLRALLQDAKKAKYAIKSEVLHGKAS